MLLAEHWVEPLADRLEADTAGNPFFVTEVVRHLADSDIPFGDGHGGRQLPEAFGVPESVREVTRRRLAALPEPVLQVLNVGAVSGSEFDAAVVALQGPDLDTAGEEPWRARLRYAYADNLLAAGRKQDAIRWFLAAAEADVEEATDAAERAVALSERPEPE